MKVLADHLEFYSQVKKYEEKNGLPDSLLPQNESYMIGVFEAKNFTSLRVIDQLYKQEFIYYAKIDKKKQEVNIVASDHTVLHIFNTDYEDLEYIPFTHV